MDQTYTVTVEDAPSPEDARRVAEGLHAYNFAIVGDDNYRPLAILLRDAGGALVGGLLGGTYWGWLHVDMLWIAAEVRGQGYGRRLLVAAEREAVARGCHHAHLDTMSFQSLPFYQRQGYQLFGQLDDLPIGHSRYFLKKRFSGSQ